MIKTRNTLAAALLLMLFITNNKISAQTIDDKVKLGVEHVYHLKFDSARVLFDEVVKANPRDPRGYFLISLLDWWKINVNREDESNDDKFMETVEKVEEIADDVLDNNEFDDNAMFYKGGAIGFRGLLRSFRQSWLKAAEDGREALNLLQKAAEINPKNKDALFGIGVYNYFAEFVPAKYPVIKPLLILFPKGDKVQGLIQIKETSESQGIAGTEAAFILGYLNLKYENNLYAAEAIFKKLVEKYPENSVFEKYLFEIYLRSNKFIEAFEGWKNIAAKSDNKQVGYSGYIQREANYNTAIALIKMNRILEAEPYINKAVDLTRSMDKENTSIGAYSYLILGMLNDAKGNRADAVRFYDKVLSMDNFMTSHTEAQAYKNAAYNGF